MFKINNLTKIYKSKEGVTVNALTNVSLDFGDKGLVFLLGKSGSGKSTLLNLLGGLDTPSDGEIIINRRSSSTFTSADFDNYRNTYVGIIFQEYNLIENYTAGDNIGLALELQGKKAERKQVDDSLRKVGLADAKGITLYNRRVNELSGGQKQRVAIARALIKEPEIILADEPTGALDRKTGESLYELFKELSKDKLIIVVTHDEENALKYGDRIIELSDGEVLADKTINHLDNNDNQEKDCNFVKSKLPFKRSFTLGASALKVKPMRLVATVLLSIIALSIFGFSIAASTVNLPYAEIQMLSKNNQRMVTLSGYAKNSSNLSAGFNKTLTNSQLETIEEFNNGKKAMIVHEPNVFFENYLDSSIRYSLSYSERRHERIIPRMSTKLVELDPVTGEQDANLTPDSRFIDKNLCRLPVTANEIAITDLYAELFITYGYLPIEDEFDNATVIDIDTPDDLVGKKFAGLTICGVYSTEIELSDFNNIYNDDSEHTWSMISGAARSYLSYGFVCEGYGGSNNFVNSGMVKLSGNVSKDYDLIKDLTYRIGNDIFTTVRLESFYSGVISKATFTDSYLFVGIMAGIIAIFSIISISLLSNFLSISMDTQKKKLGILHAIGARESDLLNICLSESLIVGGINFFLSIATSIAACVIINNNLFTSVFFVNFYTILGLLLLCLSTTVVGTFFAIKKLIKKNPIDIIADKP